MRQWRSHITRLASATLALFVALVAVPRPGLVFHVHAGGDHAHVHDDEDLHGAPHESDHEALHHHHAHGYGVGFEEPDPPELGHWHTQSPFQRAVTPASPTLLGVHGVALLPIPRPRGWLAWQPLPSRARAPPSPGC